MVDTDELSGLPELMDMDRRRTPTTPLAEAQTQTDRLVPRVVPVELAPAPGLIVIQEATRAALHMIPGFDLPDVKGKFATRLGNAAGYIAQGAAIGVAGFNYLTGQPIVDSTVIQLAVMGRFTSAASANLAMGSVLEPQQTRYKVDMAQYKTEKKAYKEEKREYDINRRKGLPAEKPTPPRKPEKVRIGLEHESKEAKWMVKATTVVAENLLPTAAFGRLIDPQDKNLDRRHTVSSGSELAALTVAMQGAASGNELMALAGGLGYALTKARSRYLEVVASRGGFASATEIPNARIDKVPATDYSRLPLEEQKARLQAYEAAKEKQAAEELQRLQADAKRVLDLPLSEIREVKNPLFAKAKTGVIDIEKSNKQVQPLVDTWNALDRKLSVVNQRLEEPLRQAYKSIVHKGLDLLRGFFATEPVESSLPQTSLPIVETPPSTPNTLLPTPRIGTTENLVPPVQPEPQEPAPQGRITVPLQPETSAGRAMTPEQLTAYMSANGKHLEHDERQRLAQSVHEQGILPSDIQEMVKEKRATASATALANQKPRVGMGETSLRVGVGYDGFTQTDLRPTEHSMSKLPDPYTTGRLEPDEKPLPPLTTEQLRLIQDWPQGDKLISGDELDRVLTIRKLPEEARLVALRLWSENGQGMPSAAAIRDRVEANGRAKAGEDKGVDTQELNAPPREWGESGEIDDAEFYRLLSDVYKLGPIARNTAHGLYNQNRRFPSSGTLNQTMERIEKENRALGTWR